MQLIWVADGWPYSVQIAICFAFLASLLWGLITLWTIINFCFLLFAIALQAVFFHFFTVCATTLLSFYFPGSWWSCLNFFFFCISSHDQNIMSFWKKENYTCMYCYYSNMVMWADADQPYALWLDLKCDIRWSKCLWSPVHVFPLWNCSFGLFVLCL